MPGFQRKYAIEINDDLMGQQGEDRHLAEKRRPGQAEGRGGDVGSVIHNIRPNV